MPKTIQIDKLRYNLIDPLCQFFLLYNLEIIAYKAKMSIQCLHVAYKYLQYILLCQTLYVVTIKGNVCKANHN